MPIDDMMLNAMLDPFRNMAKEIQDKGSTGEAMDRMMAALNKMEELGQQESDLGDFSGKMTAEGLQLEFSNAYGQVLAAEAKASQGDPEDYDDAALLKISVDALKNAVVELKRAKEAAKEESASTAEDRTAVEVAANEIDVLFKNELIIDAIEDLIKYGESGVNLPTFLRVQMEKGMDKAMEGSAVLREGLVYSQGWAEASKVNPYNINKVNEHLDVFDDLAGKAKFGVPDSLTVTLAHDKIDHHYIPDIALWDGIEDAWESIMTLMMTWSYAHMSFADQIFPWSQMPKPWPEIEKIKATYPGLIKGRIRIFKENFSLNFHDIFTHKTFVWQVDHYQLGESQLWYETLINTIFPQCTPGNNLDKETITEVERQWKGELMTNPESHKNTERFIAFFDSVFGEGAFFKKTNAKYDWGVRNAEPWDLSTFKKGS